MNSVVLRSDFFDNYSCDVGLHKLCTEWTQGEVDQVIHSKNVNSENGRTFKLVGKVTKNQDVGQGPYESALFVRIGFDWTLVAGSNIVLASCGSLNEIAVELIEFIENNKIAFEKFIVGGTSEEEAFPVSDV